MATKWKKFNRSKPIKLLSFLLATVFFASSVWLIADFVFTAEYNAENKGIDNTYYENILYQGKNDGSLVTSRMFLSEHRRVMNRAYLQGVFFKNATEEDFKEYCLKKEAGTKSAVKKEKERIEKYILEESATDEYHSTFSYLRSKRIKLELLAPISDSGNKVFYYEDGDSWIEEEDIEATTHTSLHYDVPESERTTTFPAVSSKEIDLSAYEKEGVVTVIKNARYNSVRYSGIYKVVFNDDVIEKKVQSEVLLNSDYPDCESFSEFQALSQSNEKSLSEIKNLYYAFVYENGNVYSNHPEIEASSSLEKIEKTFQKERWNYKTVYGGQSENSELIKALISEDYSYQQGINSSFFSVGEAEVAEEFQKGLSVFVALEDECWIALSDEEPKEDVFSLMRENYLTAYYRVTELLINFLITFGLFVLFLVKLIFTSGKKSEDEEIHLLVTDRIFTSVRLLINGGIIALCVISAFWLFIDGYYDVGLNKQLVMWAIMALSAIAAAFFIDLVLYFSRHIKNRSLLRNLIIGRILFSAKEKTKKAIERRKEKSFSESVIYKDLFRDVAIKTLLFVFLPNFLAMLLMLWFGGWEEWELLWITFFVAAIYEIFAAFYVGKYCYHLRFVMKALHEVRNGNYEFYLDCRKMPKAVRGYAEDINELRDGLKIAVEKAVKEEKTKTQLITNVSHDLKTPLTSIITYVDLLSRCEIPDETAKSYVAVLGEKSARLKRLIEDLVEASKASSGNIKPQLIKVNLSELVLQLAAEYEDEFSAKGLHLIMEGEKKAIFVQADSKLSYRILDNLMNNIRKYALENTRVYLNISEKEEEAFITLKNISENQLNIPASELMERFVRGDSSRSTEGNGLGLSIAQNLAFLQGGRLNIEISGDLFVAEISFKK
ncbi:MAG: HAMP domain-containing histidine kinase [Clostridia bacterium]|nr:HAMP domain-containing histidine kinase [Clostridia bacterium]